MSEIVTLSRTLEFAVLDVSAQPHPDGSYVQILRRARKLRRAVKIYGNDFGEISEISTRKNREGETVGFHGTVFRFTKIDENADWFDTSTGESATEGALEELSIPKNLRPNTRLIYWYFEIATHTLVFVRKNGEATLSPDQGAAFFSKLLNMAAEEIKEVEYVDVTTIKCSENIERIFNKPVVSKLCFDLKRPNADSPNGAMEKILAQMEADNAVRWEEGLTGPKGGTLKKSERISDLLVASKRLGTVKAITYNDSGEREEIDSKNHPKVEKKIFDPAVESSLLDFIIDVSVDIVVDLFKKKK